MNSTVAVQGVFCTRTLKQSKKLNLKSSPLLLQQMNSHLQVAQSCPHVHIKEEWKASLKPQTWAWTVCLWGRDTRKAALAPQPWPSQKMKRTHANTWYGRTSMALTHRHAHTRKARRGIRGAIHSGEKSPHWTVQRPRQGNNQRQCVCVCARVIEFWWECTSVYMTVFSTAA